MCKKKIPVKKIKIRILKTTHEIDIERTVDQDHMPFKKKYYGKEI